MNCVAYIDRRTKVALSGDALDAAMKDPCSMRCGYKLADDDKFCPMCGAIVELAAQHEKTAARTDDVDLESQEDEESVNCHKEALGLAIIFFAIYLAAIVGIMVWSVYLSSTFWLIVLLLGLFVAVGLAADAMVDIYKEAFLSEKVGMSSEKAGVLHWVAVFLLCIPLTAPAYGFIQGGIESLRCIDDGKINLMTYFANKNGMNLLARIGYRWIYHICWDFRGLEDRVLETSPLGFLSQMPVNASAMTGTVDDGDKELSHAEDDIRLGMKISTALMKNDYAKARRLARKISDKDLREFQLANIDQAESLQNSADDLKKSAKEFEDGMKAAAALQLLFGGR